jgi:hypothetical protein
MMKTQPHEDLKKMILALNTKLVDLGRRLDKIGQQQELLMIQGKGEIGKLVDRMIEMSMIVRGDPSLANTHRQISKGLDPDPSPPKKSDDDWCDEDDSVVVC